MAQGQYTYRLDVENAAALRKLAQFAKASDKATQRIEKDIRSQKKTQQELGRSSFRDLKRKYKEASERCRKVWQARTTTERKSKVCADLNGRLKRRGKSTQRQDKASKDLTLPR